MLLMLFPFRAEALTITQIYGDMDNYGTGNAIDAPLRIVDIVSDADDGLTDKFSPTYNFNWSYDFSAYDVSSILGATLTISTYDMEDNGAGDGKGGGGLR